MAPSLKDGQWLVGAELLRRLAADVVVGSAVAELLSLLNWPSEGLWIPSGASWKKFQMSYNL